MTTTKFTGIKIKNRVSPSFSVSFMGLTLGLASFKTAKLPTARFIFNSMVGGLLLIGFSLPFVGPLGVIRELTCTRLESSHFKCALQPAWLGLIPLKETPIIGLQGARVDERVEAVTDSDSGKTKYVTHYRVILLTKDGEMLLETNTPGQAELHRDLAYQINRFVNNPRQESLRVHTASPLMLLMLIPGLIFCGGFFLVYLALKGIFTWLLNFYRHIRLETVH
jgi:hypothetical protein